MRTDGAIITNAGQELLSYALANNKQVNFTKVKLGKGDVNTFDEAKKLTDVVSFYKQIPITSIARNNAGVVRIRSSFTNADFPLQVVLKEIGVFAVVEGKSEVLFGYVNDGEGESFPPGSSGNIVERVRDIYVGVSTNTQVTAVVDRSVVYATIYDLDEEIAKCAKKITRVNPGNGIHGGGTLGEDITVSIKSNDTSINLDSTNGITLKKTTSWLNDAAQLFTAKGALNLFNTLTTNFTDAINAAKEALRLDIVKKLDKGTYSGKAQDLKEDIDNRYTKNESDNRYPRYLGGIDENSNLNSYTQSGYYQAQNLKPEQFNGIDIYGWGTFEVIRAGVAIVQTLYSHQKGWIVRRNSWDSGNRWDEWFYIYNSSKKPSTLEIGAEPSFGKNSGFNKEKTDIEENDTNKLFTALGALNLKNWLVTNYTTLMNNIRDALTNMINLKLPHGGYGGNGQQLKNEIDDRYTKAQTDSIYSRGRGSVSSQNWDTLLEIGVYAVGDASGANRPSESYPYGTLVVEKNGMVTTQMYYPHSYDGIKGAPVSRTKFNDSDWTYWKYEYTNYHKPTPNDIGAYSKAESDGLYSRSRGATDSSIDWNNLTTSGTYTVNGLGNNSPGTYGWGQLCVYSQDSQNWVQIYIPHANDHSGTLWYRVSYNNNIMPWRRVQDNIVGISDIRMSGITSVVTWEGPADTYAEGRVVVGVFKDNIGANIDGVKYTTLQKYSNGTWYTVAVV